MTTVQVFDAIHDNIAHLPAGAQAAGYSTGAGTHIRWTAADWAAHPGAVRIDQDPAASDPTADVLDVEQGAATPASAPGWAKRAAISYATAARPGQRRPAIYVSRFQVNTVVNALVNAGVKGGVGLWIADWNNDQHAATAEVEAAAGPFPVIARQYKNAGAYDVSVFSAAWLKEVSVAAPAKPPVPPGQWLNAADWTWKDAWQLGVGLDGKLHVFHLENDTWVKLR
jgi:hypothetical protein